MKAYWAVMLIIPHLVKKFYPDNETFLKGTGFSTNDFMIKVGSNTMQRSDKLHFCANFSSVIKDYLSQDAVILSRT